MRSLNKYLTIFLSRHSGKSLNKTGIKGNLLNIWKSIYYKPIAQIILSVKILAIPAQRIKTKMFNITRIIPFFWCTLMKWRQQILEEMKLLFADES